jgi:hypothetical protein
MTPLHKLLEAFSVMFWTIATKTAREAQKSRIISSGLFVACGPKVMSRLRNPVVRDAAKWN